MSRLPRALPPVLIIAVLLSCGLGEKVDQVKDLAESVEQAQKKMAEGDSSGAIGALLGGGEAVQPVDFRTLKALLPERLPGFERTNASGEKSRMMGMGTSNAEGTYQREDPNGRIDVTLTDLGSVRGLGMLGINWLMVEVDKETDQGYERTVTYEGYPAYEKFEQGSDWSRGEMSAFVADRFILSVKGNGVSAEELKDALERIDLDDLEALKDAGVGEAPPPPPALTAQPGDGDRTDEPAEAPRTMTDALKQMADGQAAEPVDFRELRTLLPEELPGLPRTDAAGEKGGAMGIKTSSVTGTYQPEGDRSTRVTVKILDTGTLRGPMMLGGYPWLMMEVDKESDTSYERTTTYKGYPAYEKFEQRGNSARGTMQALVGERFVVEVEGRGVEMDVVKDAMDRLDLDRLAAMKDVGVAPAS